MYRFWGNCIDSVLEFEKAMKEMEKIAQKSEISKNKEESLVHCKDCKHYNDGTCCKTKLKTEINGFCHLAEKKKCVEFTEEEKDLAKKLYQMGFTIVTYDIGRNEFHLKSDIWKIGFHTSDQLFPTMSDNGVGCVMLIELAYDNDYE